MKTKTIIIIIFLSIILILVGIGVWSALNISPGSFPDAEIYYLDYSETKVINAVKEFKMENPKYIVPKVTIKNRGSWDLFDGPQDETPGRYYFYFYCYDENQIILTSINGSDERTIIYLISVNKGLDVGNWKHFNRDFEEDENEKQKKLFEEQILQKIKSVLSKK